MSDIYEAIETFGLIGDDAANALPLPDDDSLTSAVEISFRAMIEAMTGTLLELADLEPFLWSSVNVYHLRAERIARQRHDCEADIRLLLERQDGSEIASTELENAQMNAERFEARENDFITMREHAAKLYEVESGRPWTPRTGSRTGKIVTAAMIDSRDYLRASKEREINAAAPQGSPIAVIGDLTWNDTNSVWKALDRARDRVGDMVLVHGGNSKGVDKIASLWAQSRSVATVICRPDFSRHGKAAPFKRNDQIIRLKPQAVIFFPSESGVALNLAQKAAEKKITVWEPLKIKQSAECETA